MPCRTRASLAGPVERATDTRQHEQVEQQRCPGEGQRLPPRQPAQQQSEDAHADVNQLARGLGMPRLRGAAAPARRAVSAHDVWTARARQYARRSASVCSMGISGFQPVSAVSRAWLPTMTGLSLGRNRDGSTSMRTRTVRQRQQDVEQRAHGMRRARADVVGNAADGRARRWLRRRGRCLGRR